MVSDVSDGEDGKDVGNEPTSAEWRLFEQAVARFLEELGGNARVEHNVRVEGRLSKTERQIDVLVRQDVVGHEVRIVCECKHYASKSVGIGMVDEMVGKVLDIGADAGIMFALRGYTANAEARAAGASNPKIELRELPADADRDYTDLIHSLIGHDCPACEWGIVSWHLWPDPDGGLPVGAGFCDSCGVLAVACNNENCGAITALINDEQQCDNCEAVYRQVNDHKGLFEDVVRVS